MAWSVVIYIALLPPGAYLRHAEISQSLIFGVRQVVRRGPGQEGGRGVTIFMNVDNDCGTPHPPFFLSGIFRFKVAYG